MTLAIFASRYHVDWGPHQSQHTPSQVLEECHQAGVTGVFYIIDHALDRMEQRNVRQSEVRRALAGATTATFQPDNGRWRISGGTDGDGTPLELAVSVRNGIVVVSLF